MFTLSPSHGTFESELRSERRSGQQREQAGPVFDRCVLLLEPATSSVLHNCVARTGLFRPRAEPSQYLITWAQRVTTGVCVGGNGTVNKRRIFIAQG